MTTVLIAGLGACSDGRRDDDVDGVERRGRDSEREPGRDLRRGRDRAGADRRYDSERRARQRDRQCAELCRGDALVEKHRGEQRDKRRMEIEKESGETGRSERKRCEIRDRLAAVSERSQRDQRAERPAARYRIVPRPSIAIITADRSQSEARAALRCPHPTRTRSARGSPSPKATADTTTQTTPT
jgi:hypothetical protein